MTPSITARRLTTIFFYMLTSATYRKAKKSALFIPDLYLTRNPDVSASGADPLAHYLSKGYRELRQLGPLFDVSYYFSQAPELKSGQGNPLIHFLERGYLDGLVPNPFCDLAFYQKHHNDFDSTVDNVLSHFFRKGYAVNNSSSPSPYFDPSYYCQTYPDARQLANRPDLAYLHFLTHGLKEARQPSTYFDPEWYLDKTPALREKGFDAFTHYLYLKIGVREKKSPSPLFDPLFYTKRCRLAEDIDPFAHYLSRQDDLEARPRSWFDPAFYRRTYLHQDPTPPLKHFLDKGLRQGFYPNGDIAGLAVKPLISVVLPVYNVASAHLNTCIRSVLYQSYPHWQLCLADDCSSDPAIRPLLRRWHGEDPRITAVFLDRNSGISAATNVAAGIATGDYLLFLDHDDELAPEAMATFVEYINRQPADLYYSDEDLIGADGRQFSIFRKPSFNAELLLCHNYVTHCVVAKRSLYETVGGCDSTYDGAQDLDLFLKLSERADRVVHIPEILYHWRASEKSTSINHQQKHYADGAGRNCVAAALARRGINGEVLGCEWKFFYRAKRAVQPSAKVALVLDWRRHQPQKIDISSLVATAGATINRILILTTEIKEIPLPAVGNGDLDVIFKLVTCPNGRSTASVFSEIFNADDSDYLAWLDGSLHPQSDQWLSALLEYGQNQEVAMVRGQLTYNPQDHPNITPIADITQQSPHYFARFLADCSVLMNGGQCPQEVMAVADGVFLFHNTWLRTHPEMMAGPFRETFFFLDLSMRLHQCGAKNIYTPYCSCTVASAPSRRELEDASSLCIEEQRRFQSQWAEVLAGTIPFYNTRIIGDANHSEEDFRRWLIGKYL